MCKCSIARLTAIETEYLLDNLPFYRCVCAHVWTINNLVCSGTLCGGRLFFIYFVFNCNCLWALNVLVVCLIIRLLIMQIQIKIIIFDGTQFLKKCSGGIATLCANFDAACHDTVITPKRIWNFDLEYWDCCWLRYFWVWPRAPLER